jgi:hypothetical protein
MTMICKGVTVLVHVLFKFGVEIMAKSFSIVPSNSLNVPFDRTLQIVIEKKT